MGIVAAFEIYALTSDDYWYVGSTTRGAELRFAEHKKLRGNARRLHEKIVELGEVAFTLEVIESAIGDPIVAEQRWYDVFVARDQRTTLNGHRPGSLPCQLGKVLSVETKAKISAANTGRKRSPEQRARMRAGHVGVTRSPLSSKHKAKLRTIKLGTSHSDETKAKMRANHSGSGHSGHSHSQATRLKLSIAAKERERRKRVAKSA